MTTRSIIKDFDIKFANEYEHFNMQPVYTNAEYVWNKYPPGVSFFWIPALFVADGFSNSSTSTPEILSWTIGAYKSWPSILLSAVVLVIVGSFGRNVLGVIPKLVGVLDGLLMLIVPAAVIVALKTIYQLAKD